VAGILVLLLVVASAVGGVTLFGRDRDSGVPGPSIAPASRPSTTTVETVPTATHVPASPERPAEPPETTASSVLAPPPASATPPSTSVTSTSPPHAGHRHLPSAVVRGTAFLSVAACSPYADVYLAGRRLGATPLVVDVPAGHMTLRLVSSGADHAATQIALSARDGEEIEIGSRRCP
jgi:hypothetical protein